MSEGRGVPGVCRAPGIANPAFPSRALLGRGRNRGPSANLSDPSPVAGTGSLEGARRPSEEAGTRQCGSGSVRRERQGASDSPAEEPRACFRGPHTARRRRGGPRGRVRGVTGGLTWSGPPWTCLGSFGTPWGVSVLFTPSLDRVFGAVKSVPWKN